VQNHDASPCSQCGSSRMLLVCVCVLVFCGRSIAQEKPGPLAPAPPRPVIESFAPVKAFVVGDETVTLVGTIRNTSKSAIPAGAWNARLYCLAGLDYTEGDTMPRLPALEPNAATTFRWRVQATSDTAPLVAALALESPGTMPEVRVIGIQHLGAPPPAEHSAVSKL